MKLLVLDLVNLNLEAGYQSSCNFEAFWVNEAIPFATCLVLVRICFGILKQIQIRVLNEIKQTIFWLKLFNLDCLDLFISKYFAFKQVKRI